MNRQPAASPAPAMPCDAAPSRERAGSDPGRARGERRLLRDRLLFLNDATVTIGASLDLRQVARGLGDVLVPALGDVAAVYLLEALFDGQELDAQIPEPAVVPLAPVRTVAVSCDPACVPPRHRVAEGGVQVMSPAGPVHRAMATGEPVVLPLVDDAVAQTLAGERPGEGLPPLIRGHSAVVLPLSVRGRVLGAVLVSRRPDRGAIEDVDFLMARQLAAQAGLGVDNAYLYQTQAVIADALQRSMLPARLPEPAGVEVAHRYVPASDTAQVGGDWFDAIALPGSRVALVVGDVMGHGVRSAATMGQFRTAVQTLAALDLPPGQVLRHLDDLARGLGDDHLATCVYAVYDPVARRCVIANAGHIPPVLLHSNGRAEVLSVPTGAPIGVGGVAFEPVEMAVADGDVLVLCTDGLVEVRGEDIRSGLLSLCAHLETPAASLDERCERLLGAMHRDAAQDDVALLMAHFRGIPSEDVVQWLLEPRASTPGRARRLIRSTLAGWGLSDHSDLTELLATELVTNAVRHGTRPIELRLLRTDALLCEVSDDDHHLPVLRYADDDDEGGRGLQLVSRLARRWGSSRTSTGKVVWFEQALGGP
ncbi:MAG TPA: SpoIIE family protein phosphatase [Actinomadura sp.]|nr:SpoIIE family protein phosphatase [Actinomadura sp.]